MGGHLSCMHIAAGSANPETDHCSCSGVLKVVLACEGRTCEFSQPVKVAELMLEFPNHFVTEYDNMHNYETCSGGTPAAAQLQVFTKRVSPLPADHDAKPCHVYLLLPMHRLNTRLSAHEIALVSALLTAAAPPYCATSGQLSYPKTSKVTPLSSHQTLQEAAAAMQQGTATGRSRSSSISNVSIAKSYSVPILELLEDAAMEEDDTDEQSDLHVNSRQHLHVLRSKSWTPKLETILESYL